VRVEHVSATAADDDPAAGVTETPGEFEADAGGTADDGDGACGDVHALDARSAQCPHPGPCEDPLSLRGVGQR